MVAQDDARAQRGRNRLRPAVDPRQAVHGKVDFTCGHVHAHADKHIAFVQPPRELAAALHAERAIQHVGGEVGALAGEAVVEDTSKE